MLSLNYKQIGNGKKHLIILHGFLGSADNFQTVAKALENHFTIYLIDARNHGKSPHNNLMSYQVMANDIVDFCQTLQINKTSIIGHSMGGKTAMYLALTQPKLIHQLFVVDIAPIKYQGNHQIILNAMQHLNLKQYTQRKDIQKEIEKSIKNDTIVQLILKNLKRTPTGFEWKCNLPILIQEYKTIMDFPNINAKNTSKDIYFIKGALSDYITIDNWNNCIQYFPNAHLIEIANAKHWVHAENYHEFVQTILNNAN